MKRMVSIGCLIISLMLSGCNQNVTDRDTEVNQSTQEELPDTAEEETAAFLNPDRQIESIPERYYQEIVESGQVERFDYTTGEGKPKHAMVYIPYGYDEEEKYDVVYLMHGGGGSAEGVLGYEGGNNDLTRILDNLIENGDMKPLIVVAPTFYPEEGADSSVTTAEGLVTLFPDEWANDLVPALEGTYSTYAESMDEAGLIASRDHRAFGGFSMGSVTTWYVFMEKLAYTSTFLPISGDCWAKGRQAGQTNSEETAKTLQEALAETEYGPHDFYIYAMTGTDDIAESSMTPQIEEMQKISDTFIFSTDRNEGNIRYRVKEGGSHDMTNVKQYLYNMLPTLWPIDEQVPNEVQQFFSYESEEITLENGGQKIYGVAFIPQTGEERHPLVICSHGLGGSYHSQLDTAEELASWGVAVYCFDFRGGGGNDSEGAITDMSVMTEVDDLETVFQDAKSWSFVDSERIVLLGDSQGGIVSAITAARHESEIAGLILNYPAFLITDAIHEQFSSKEDIEDEYSFNWFRAGRVYAEDMWDYDVYQEIGDYTKKVLLLHGSRDSIVPISYSEKAAEVYTNVDYFIIDGAGHGFSGDHFDEAMEHTCDYLQEINILMSGGK